MPGNKRKQVKKAKKAEKIYNNPAQARGRKIHKEERKAEQASNKLKVAADDLKKVQNLSSNLVVPNQLQEISITSNISPASIVGVMVGYLSSILGRGYLANITAPDEAYWAFTYGVKVLTDLANNSTMDAAQFPHWMVCLGQAMAGKSCSFKGGLVTYNNQVSEITPSPDQILSPNSYNYKWVLYVPSNVTPVNGFPVAVAPSTPTLGQAQTAWTKLTNYMQASTKTSYVADNGRIEPYGKTKWIKDVSSFAYHSALTGWAYGETGGWTYTANLEVPILTPLLSGLISLGSNNAIVPSRFGNYSTSASSNCVFVGGAFSTMLPEHEWRMKRYPRLHYVDFLEFVDVIAQWVALSAGLFAKDQSNSPQDITCPITLQELSLLLRNEFMFVFGDTQPSVQSSYQQLPNTGTDNVFAPFLSGTTTCGLQSAGVKIPLAVVENIKCLVYREYIPKDPKGNDIVRDPQYYIPVIGKYAQDVLQASDYTYVDSAGATVPAFFDASAVLIKKRLGAKESMEVQAEPPIDLVDGSTGSSYLFINDPTRLATLAAFWNEWVAKISSYSQSLATVSKDIGPSVLVSIGATNHWKTLDGGAKTRSESFVDTRRIMRPTLSNTVYSNRQRFAVSNQAIEYAEIMKFVANWILPVNSLDAPLNQFSFTDYNRVKEMMGECYAVQTTSTGDSGQTMSEMHSNYANHLIKPKWGAADDWEMDLENFQKHGQGGVLASIASTMAGGLFGATAGQIVGTIGQALGL